MTKERNRKRLFDNNENKSVIPQKETIDQILILLFLFISAASEIGRHRHGHRHGDPFAVVTRLEQTSHLRRAPFIIHALTLSPCACVLSRVCLFSGFGEESHQFLGGASREKVSERKFNENSIWWHHQDGGRWPEARYRSGVGPRRRLPFSLCLPVRLVAFVSFGLPFPFRERVAGGKA